MTRIVAVVVTYNRERLVQECLDGLAAQTRPLDAVVVIDNASTDGSGDVARAHPIDADVVTLAGNHGGAGGFAAGLARALRRHEPDWVWLMDDDTVPTPEAIAELEAVIDSYDGAGLDVLSSTAVWTDGRVHPMNASRQRVGASAAELSDAAAVGARAIRTASFVAILLRASACRERGLPYADYFIWGDDTEYSARLLREGRGLQVAASVVEHRTKAFASWTKDPGPRFYYEIRNKLWVYLRSGSFRPWERALYLGSAGVGWLRTLARGMHRVGLVRDLGRGVVDALAAGPRPSTVVLEGEPAVIEDVRAVEAAAPAHPRRPGRRR